MKLTPAKADKEVVFKWEWFAKNADPKLSDMGNLLKLREKYPRFNNYEAGCAYCELYDDDCNICPIGKIGEGCRDFNGKIIFHKWCHDCTKANARAMLKVVKRAVAWRREHAKDKS